MRGTAVAGNIFDRNYATGLLTKQQQRGSLKSVELLIYGFCHIITSVLN